MLASLRCLASTMGYLSGLKTKPDPTSSMSLKRDGKQPSGGYGTYFKIDELRGVKVLHSATYSSAAAVDLSPAEKEAECQMRARERLGDMVAEVYGVIIVYLEDRNAYCPGIVMQHIDGTTFYQHYRTYDEKVAAHQKIYDALAEAAIIKSDTHSGNVMVDKNGKHYIIDWGLGAQFGEIKKAG